MWLDECHDALHAAGRNVQRAIWLSPRNKDSHLSTPAINVALAALNNLRAVLCNHIPIVDGPIAPTASTPARSDSAKAAPTAGAKKRGKQAARKSSSSKTRRI